MKPSKATIQPVTVVPIFAPIITPIAWLRFKRPALTKLTIITVVAEDDCTRAVIKNPVKTAATLFFVIILRIAFNLSPAVF